MIDYRRIDIIRNFTEACICISLEKNYREFFAFCNYKQNCIYASIESDVKTMLKDHNILLVIHLMGCDDENFFKTLNYNFIYRRQNKLALPPEIDNLTRKQDLSLFIDFLINEHLDMMTKNESSSVPEIINPLCFINKDFLCMKTFIPESLKKRLFFIPCI